MAPFDETNTYRFGSSRLLPLHFNQGEQVMKLRVIYDPEKEDYPKVLDEDENEVKGVSEIHISMTNHNRHLPIAKLVFEDMRIDIDCEVDFENSEVDKTRRTEDFAGIETERVRFHDFVEQYNHEHQLCGGTIANAISRLHKAHDKSVPAEEIKHHAESKYIKFSDVWKGSVDVKEGDKISYGKFINGHECCVIVHHFDKETRAVGIKQYSAIEMKLEYLMPCLKLIGYLNGEYKRFMTSHNLKYQMPKHEIYEFESLFDKDSEIRKKIMEHACGKNTDSFLSVSEIEKAKREMSELEFRQEYLCEFINVENENNEDKRKRHGSYQIDKKTEQSVS